MSENLVPIIPNKSKKDRTYFMLILSEGYPNKTEFDTHCKTLIKHLVTIPPLNILKKYIEFYKYFTPSTIDGIPEGSQGDTVYKFFIESGQIITEEPWLIAEKIEGLKLTFNYALPFIPIDISTVWYNRTISRNRIIIVLAKNSQKIHSIYRWNYMSDLEDRIKAHYPGDQMEERERARAVFPVLAMTSWPWGISGADEYHKPQLGAAYALTQYLGEIFGLGTEYEKNGAEFQKLLIGDDEYLEYPNLFAYKLSETSTVPPSSDIDYLPWRSLILPRITAGIELENHPAPTNTTGFKRIQGIMSSKVVLLMHPDSTSANQALYNSSPARFINRINSPNIIEGGLGYRLDIFRPNTDCLMRHDSITTSVSGKNKPSLNPFCKVCRLYIRGCLGTSKNYIFKGITFKYNPYHPSLKPIESRIASKFADHCENTYHKYSNSDLYICVAASFRRFESFFIDVLKWRRNGEGFHRITLTSADAIENYQGQYLNYPKSPFIDYSSSSRSRSYVHNLWAGNIKHQRDKRNTFYAHNYLAGTGAPGTLEFLGFGTIYNHMEEVHFNGSTYYRYENKTYNELLAYLDDLPRGTLLKLSETHNDYDAVVRYVNGLITAVEVQNITGCEIKNETPKVSGHSLVYMGQRADGKHLIYDQHRNPYKNGTLENTWEGFEYIIIGQWFDGENI